MTPPSACFCLYLTGEDPAATSRNRPVAGTQIASNGARPVLQSGPARAHWSGANALAIIPAMGSPRLPAA
jgi:hypothetical protein